MAYSYDYIVVSGELRKYRWTKKEAEDLIGCRSQECLDLANEGDVAC